MLKRVCALALFLLLLLPSADMAWSWACAAQQAGQTLASALTGLIEDAR